MITVRGYILECLLEMEGTGSVVDFVAERSVWIVWVRKSTLFLTWTRFHSHLRKRWGNRREIIDRGQSGRHLHFPVIRTRSTGNLCHLHTQERIEAHCFGIQSGICIGVFQGREGRQ